MSGSRDVQPRSAPHVLRATGWRRRLPTIAFVFVGLSLLLLAVTPVLMTQRLRETRRDSDATTLPALAALAQLRLLYAEEVIAVQRLRVRVDPAAAQRFRELRAEELMLLARLDSLSPGLGATVVERIDRLRRLSDRMRDLAGVDGLLGARDRDLGARPPEIDGLADSLLATHDSVETEIEGIEIARRVSGARYLDGQRLGSSALGVIALLAMIALAWFGSRDLALTRALGDAMEQETRLRAEEAKLRAVAEEQHEDLVRVSESKNRLMRGFTHDVKNPLGAADGYLQLLEAGINGPLSDAQQRSVSRVRGSIGSALALIEDLLEVARAETGNIQVACIPIDLGAVASDAAEDFRGPAESKGLALRINIATDMPPVYSDPVRVRQVLGNVISNAVKYTPHGTVTIDVCQRVAGRRAGDVPGVAVEVSDTGPGVPQEKQRLLFREFVRLDPNAGPGIGLGLAISFKIVQALGGELSMRDAPNGGSRFVLWLPLEETRGTSLQSPSIASDPASPGS